MPVLSIDAKKHFLDLVRCDLTALKLAENNP
jgi:hypothetical protein